MVYCMCQRVRDFMYIYFFILFSLLGSYSIAHSSCAVLFQKETKSKVETNPDFEILLKKGYVVFTGGDQIGALPASKLIGEWNKLGQPDAQLNSGKEKPHPGFFVESEAYDLGRLAVHPPFNEDFTAAIYTIELIVRDLIPRNYIAIPTLARMGIRGKDSTPEFQGLRTDESILSARFVLYGDPGRVANPRDIKKKITSDEDGIQTATLLTQSGEIKPVGEVGTRDIKDLEKGDILFRLGTAGKKFFGAKAVGWYGDSYDRPNARRKKAGAKDNEDRLGASQLIVEVFYSVSLMPQ